jgi:hypothetical protein
MESALMKSLFYRRLAGAAALLSNAVFADKTGQLLGAHGGDVRQFRHLAAGGFGVLGRSAESD